MQTTLPEVVQAEFKNHWSEIAEADYHKDLTAVARGDILAALKSPASFIARRQKEEEQEDSAALKFGRAAHMLALEPQKFKAVYRLMPDFGDMRSSKNREKRDGWLADLPQGAEALPEEDFNHVLGICDSVLKHPRAKLLFETGLLEKAGYYRDPVTGLKGRIKPDCVSEELNGLFDFKTTRDITAKKFSTSIWEHRYDIQLAKYAFGTEQILGRKPDVLGWVAVEKLPPYETAVYIATPQMIELGERDFRLGMNRIKECIEKGDWPFHQIDMENIDFPFWVYTQQGLA